VAEGPFHPGIRPVASLDDERVAPYRWVADPRRLEAEGLFVAEGRLVVPQLLAASSRPGRWFNAAHSLLLSPSAFEHIQSQLEPYPQVPVYVVPQPLMNDLVGFNIHRGCLALGRRPLTPVLDAVDLEPSTRVIVLEGVNNPDNIGGIFRSAAAFNADLVALGPACADPLYRKSIRTSIGATLAVPCAQAEPWPQALDQLKRAGFRVIALSTAPGSTPLPQLRATPARIALLAGAEGTGLSEVALAAADECVTIPMSGCVDSLNVATALAIALYHVSLK
jgi:tRNA G18 (ribose-2'-O)-methylase SpoU